MKTLKLIAATTALSLSCLACAVPAAAAAEEETRSETVSYSDLDLGTPIGAAALYSRLKRAAWHVCRGAESLDQVNICMRSAVAGAVKGVNRPSLTAVHEGRAPTGLTARR